MIELISKSGNWISQRLGNFPQVIHLVRPELRNKIKERNKSRKSLQFVTAIQEGDHQAWTDIMQIQIWKICLGDLAEGERIGLGELLDKGIKMKAQGNKGKE